MFDAGADARTSSGSSRPPGLVPRVSQYHSITFPDNIERQALRFQAFYVRMAPKTDAIEKSCFAALAIIQPNRLDAGKSLMANGSDQEPGTPCPASMGGRLPMGSLPRQGTSTSAE